MKTLVTLVFNETSSDGINKHKKYPSGTKLLPVETVSEESEICRKRADELTRKNRVEYVVLLLAGKPRILERRVVGD